MNKSAEQKPSYTKSQLAALMGMSLSTFQRKLKKKEIEVARGLISYQEAIMIKAKLGYEQL